MLPTIRRPALLAVVIAGLAACAPGGGLTSPTPSFPSATRPVAGSPAPVVPHPTSAAPSTTLAPSPRVTSGSSAAPLPAQSATEWGRIWDALPPGFPVPAGASGADPGEPASGAYDTALPAADVATAMQAALERARFSTEFLAGPLEGGDYVISLTGEPGSGCRVETRIAPLGAMTRVTVLYGADCPFPLD